MNMHFDIPAIQIAGGSSFSSLDVSHIVVTVTDKIDSFAALQKGWDYAAGEPIPTDRTRAAKVWVSFLEFLGFSNLDASPGSDGEISVAGSFGDHYLEIIVEADDKSISIAYDFEGKQKFYKLKMPFIEALASIMDVMGEIWNASTLYTQGNITLANVSGFGLHSGTTRDPYQFSPAHASTNLALLLASTPATTMAPTWGYVANHQFGGGLTQGISHPAAILPWMDHRRSAITSSRG
jgi:hypothetical protein